MSWKAVEFTGNLQRAVGDFISHIEAVPHQLAVNVDDFWASGARGERLRFPYIAPTGYETFDAIPDRYVPRGTFIAMWREPRGFAQDLWSKWWGSQ